MNGWTSQGMPVPIDPSVEFRPCRPGTLFPSDSPRLADAGQSSPFSHRGSEQAYSASFDEIRCVVMQGGQGEVKHWAFNDPPRRKGRYKDAPPSPAEYRKLKTRVTDLHPMTIIQNARTSGGGQVSLVPTKAATVGPRGDMEGGESVDLAGRQPRQSLRHAAHDVDDRQAAARFVGADVAAGRSSERAVQFLPAGIGTVDYRNALAKGST